MNPLLKADDVARLLRVRTKKVYDLVSTRQPGFNRPLPAIRFGVRGLRFDPAEVEAWIAEHRQAPPSRSKDFGAKA